MKWTFASFFMVMLGLTGLFIIFLFQDITVSNEDDYFLLKEITEASMMDSIDLAYYRLNGEVIIEQEKFIEVFLRRFAESSTLSAKGYKVEFYDIIEDPPKVTVKVANKTHSYNVDTEDFNIINELSAIIETNG